MNKGENVTNFQVNVLINKIINNQVNNEYCKCIANIKILQIYFIHVA